jgi:hypothetical protein
MTAEHSSWVRPHLAALVPSRRCLAVLCGAYFGILASSRLAVLVVIPVSAVLLHALGSLRRSHSILGYVISGVCIVFVVSAPITVIERHSSRAGVSGLSQPPPLPTTPSPATTPSVSSAPPAALAAVSHIALGAPIELGLNAGPIASAGNGVWGAISTGLVHVHPGAAGYPQGTPLKDDIAEVAAWRRTLAIVRNDGSLRFFSVTARKNVGGPITFSEASGRVVVNSEAAWVCNQSHSKIDRIDLGTHVLAHLNSPGVPQDIESGSDGVWATTSNGWLLHTRPKSESPLRLHVPDAAGQLAIAHDVVWVDVTRSRQLVAVDKSDGHQAATVAAPADVEDMLIANGWLWIAATANDQIWAINLRTLDILKAKLRAPTRLIRYGAQVYVSTANALVPLAVAGQVG